MDTKPLPWADITGRKVRIYRNLNNGTMSVQLHTKGIGWRVVGSTTDAIAANVTFRVSEAGRQRVIRDQCKNVHAYCEGILLTEFDESIAASIELTYNPYRNTSFVEKASQQAVTHCKLLAIRGGKVFISADALTT